MTENKMFAVFLIVVAFLLSFWIGTGVVYFAYGVDGVQTLLTMTGYILILVAIVFVVIVIQLVGAWINNLSNRNFISAQVSNDKADVAKFHALRESLRGQNEYERDVRKHALPMARMIAKNDDVPVIQAASWALDDEDEDAEYTTLE